LLNSQGMLTSSHVLTDLSKHVKTSCGYVNIAKKPATTMKIFLNCKLQDIPNLRGYEQLSSTSCWRVMAI